MLIDVQELTIRGEPPRPGDPERHFRVRYDGPVRDVSEAARRVLVCGRVYRMWGLLLEYDPPTRIPEPEWLGML